VGCFTMSNVEPTADAIDEIQFDPAVLGSYEAWWRDQQLWLKDRGYMLRPRLRADWTPSWKGTKKLWVNCEDGQIFPAGSLLDATRMSDGKLVGLKRVHKPIHPLEAEICQFFFI